MSQETPAPPVTVRAGPAAPVRGARRATALFAGWLRTDVFRRTEAAGMSWRKAGLAVAAVVAATAVSLSRTVGAGSLNTIWIEDAKYLLNQGLNLPFWTAVNAP